MPIAQRPVLPTSVVDDFQQDGAVLLRGVLADEWLEKLSTGVEYNRTNPSQYGYGYTKPGSSVGFWADYVTWQNVPEYRDIAFNSGLAAHARQLMGSTTSRFFHEHVLVKEAATAERTPWHHDQPYYCVNGDQNVSMWAPLDTVPAHSGMRLIAGSHRWNRWFIPRKFIDHTPYAQPSEHYELIPDIDAMIADDPSLRVLSFDVEPGDVVAFHYRTLHDAAGTTELDGGRRVVSLRWIGDDATFGLRPWLHSPPFEQADLELGGPLDDDRFPLVD